MSTIGQNDGTKGKATVLLVDDHPVVRDGLAGLINHQSDMVVCGAAEDVKGALKKIAELTPDVAVVDISLDRDMGGLDLIVEAKSRFPDLIILVLSMHDESVYASRALRAGASGYVTKQEAMETVLTAIRQILKGQIYASEKVVSQVMSGLVGGRPQKDGFALDRLTNREIEILQLIGRGISTRRIAEKLFLSVKTVETHRMHIKEKLNLADAAELREYAIEWARTQEPG